MFISKASFLFRHFISICIFVIPVSIITGAHANEGQWEDKWSWEDKWYWDGKWYRDRKSGNGYLYTIENGANNAVLGYRIENDGSLTSLGGTPFLTGGEGLQAPVLSQHAMVTDANQKYMFVVNPKSQDISVMKIRRNGYLKLLEGSPFSTGGNGPLSSLAISSDVLYAAHNAPGAEYRGMRISRGGQLSPIPDAVYPLANGAASVPVAIEFDPSGDTLVGLRFSFDTSLPGGNAIDTYNFDLFSGLLSPAPGSPLVTSVEDNNTQPLAFAFNPIDSSQLFVGNAVDVTAPVGTVSSYLISPAGQVVELESSPTSSGNHAGTAWIALTEDGKSLYVLNTASDNISHFSVARDASLTLESVIDVLDIDTRHAPRSLVFSENDQYLYVLNGHAGVDLNGGTIVGFKRLEDGKLEALPDNPLVTIDEQPVGLIYINR